MSSERAARYGASEKQNRVQCPVGGEKRTKPGRTRREVEIKLHETLAKQDTYTLEKSKISSPTEANFLLACKLHGLSVGSQQ